MLSYGWQSDSSLWAQISDYLRDDSWKYVDFAEIEAVAVPAGESGVYALCVCPVGNRFSLIGRAGDFFSNLVTPIYVGRTINLRQRFLEHCRRPSVQVRSARNCFGPAMTFWFHRVAEKRIKYDEAVLIKCFGPTANEREESISATLGEPLQIGVHDETNRT